MNQAAEYARVAALQQQTAQSQQQMQQAQAMAPGQQQLQQQQIEAQKRQFADQDALTKAMTAYNSDKHTPDDIPGLIAKNGGSGQLQTATQQHLLQLKDTASQIAERDATSGSKNIDTYLKRHDAAIGALQSAMDTDDASLADHLNSKITDLGQAGFLRPDEVAHGQQLAQLAAQNPQAARQQLPAYLNGFKTEQQIFKEAQDTAKTEQENWKPAGPGTLINVKTGETKQGSLPVDQAEMADYLQKHPGQGPADFLSWKAKQSPMAMVMGNMLKGSAIDQAAERYSTDGSLPSGFARSPGTTAAIIQRSAELHPDQNLASNKATFQADTGALKQVQKQFDVMNAFEGTALRNLDLYAQTAAKIPDLGARFANVPLRMITGSMIGTDNMAALKAARETAATEVAKVLGSATGSGVLSDSQKKEAQDVIDGNLPMSATLAVVNTLKQDMANRHQSYQADIDAIKGRLGAKPTQPIQQNTANPKAGAFSWDAMPKHQ